MPITLEFDASYCRISNLNKQSEAYKRLLTNLSYTDSKIDYSNRINTYTAYKDPTVCLLDNNNRFYTGLLARVVWVLENCGEQYTLKRNIDSIQPSLSVELPDWMYEHQRSIINKCLDVKRGVVQSPTGSGSN